MANVEWLSSQSPYNGIPLWEYVHKAVLEIPSGIRSVIRSQLRPHAPDVNLVRTLISQSIDILTSEGAGRSYFTDQAEVEGYLSHGYESSILSFTVGSTRWVAKIGHSQAFTSGLFSPSSNEYANMMGWNHSVLERVYSPYLPYFLPKPYFILSPEQLGYPSTIQLTPFIEKLPNPKDLTREQNYNVWRERLLFASLSDALLKEYKVLPDLVKLSNLVLGLVDSAPHLVLLDIGLFHLYAPNPLLNALAFSAYKFTILKDKILFRSLPENNRSS